MISVGVGHERGSVVGVDDLGAVDLVAVRAVAGLDVDLVAFGQLRKVDPVHVVGGDADRPRIAGPSRGRIVARAGVQHTAVHAFFDCGEVVQLGHADREVDAVDRTLEARIDGLVDRAWGAGVVAPDLVHVLLLGDAPPHAIAEGAEQDQPYDQARKRQH